MLAGLRLTSQRPLTEARVPPERPELVAVNKESHTMDYKRINVDFQHHFSIIWVDMKTPGRCSNIPRHGKGTGVPMQDTDYTTTDRNERMIRAYMDGAESGMIEVRGYGLTPDERADAERVARDLYDEPEIAAA